MKILHTSDWHLGQKLIEKDRAKEHDIFFNWLLQTLEERQVDILVIAGDIFDVHNPPKDAENRYATFLAQASRVTRHIIVVAGNHDSTSTLEAYKPVLRALNVHVVGAFNEDPSQEILTLKNGKSQTIEAVIAAAPFLRDNFLARSIAAEEISDRKQRIAQAIRDHYARLADAIAIYEKEGIPLLATGHLFAAGGLASESEKQIHIGTLDNITADVFSPIFSYVALGHLHRPQKVAKQDCIRYSGSPIPLSFSEAGEKKEVLLLEYEGALLTQITPLPIPTSRALRRIKGSLEETLDVIAGYDALNREEELEPWFDSIITANSLGKNEQERLLRLAKERNLELLSIKLEKKQSAEARSWTETFETFHLEKLEPAELFKQKFLLDRQTEPTTEVWEAFYELASLVENNENEI
jgi:exonuclease SbcD